MQWKLLDVCRSNRPRGSKLYSLVYIDVNGKKVVGISMVLLFWQVTAANWKCTNEVAESPLSLGAKHDDLT